MLILIFVLNFLSIQCVFRDFCYPDKRHALCRVTCMQFPKLCQFRKKKYKDKELDGSHYQGEFPDTAIRMLTDALNQLRARVMKETQKFVFSDFAKAIKLPKPKMLYDVVSQSDFIIE